ncbi:MAG: nucleotide exchange factor GrpE [Proteobacteria bacterium]|nr:nucleotide exchange factor GrpE [Pseudomonadota bacterium]
MSDEIETPETEAEESLDEMILRLEAEIGEWKDHALRAAAEADNVRRRAEREMNDARAYAIQRFAKDLFGVADNLQRALQAVPKDAADPALKSLATGVELIEKSLHTAFESNGVKKIDPQPGEKFDPNQHQAVMEQPSAEVPAGGVIQVLQTGYSLFGRVVRPAMVAVAAKGAAAAPSGGGETNPYAKTNGPTEGEAVDTKA